MNKEAEGKTGQTEENKQAILARRCELSAENKAKERSCIDVNPEPFMLLSSKYSFD